MEPTVPNVNTPALAEPASAPYFKDQVAVLGSKIPKSSLPSPFQSPITGAAPGAENWNSPAVGGPADNSFLREKVSVEGVKTPMPEARSERASSPSNCKARNFDLVRRRLRRGRIEV